MKDDGYFKYLFPEVVFIDRLVLQPGEVREKMIFNGIDWFVLAEVLGESKGEISKTVGGECFQEISSIERLDGRAFPRSHSFNLWNKSDEPLVLMVLKYKRTNRG